MISVLMREAGVYLLVRRGGRLVARTLILGVSPAGSRERKHLAEVYQERGVM